MQLTGLLLSSLLLLLAGCGGSNSSSTSETPTQAPTAGDGDSADDSSTGDDMSEEDLSDLPPDACQNGGGVCAESTCEERGVGEIMGTCYLNDEPQTNLNCCAES